MSLSQTGTRGIAFVKHNKARQRVSWEHEQKVFYFFKLSAMFCIEFSLDKSQNTVYVFLVQALHMNV